MAKRQFELNGIRQEIVSHKGHLLVLGGPGSGKTTVALLKAKQLAQALTAGQEILFLSFSRAAVRQVLLRCADVLAAKERAILTVKTYHAFCIEALQSHERVLTAAQPRFVFPREESIQRADHEGDWSEEVARMAGEGVYCFDAVAGGVARLLENSTAVRNLYCQKFPYIVVDEFQDTDESQWKIVQALSTRSTIFCLADAEQRIFDYRKDIDPNRIDKAQEFLASKVFDLGAENHRSPNAGILSFADAVLRNQPLPITPDVNLRLFRFANQMPPWVHIATITMFQALRKLGVEGPTVAVLCRSNALVAQLSGILSEQRDVTVKGTKRALPPLEHIVVWDDNLTLSAAGVVASILEWPAKPERESVQDTLLSISNFYRLKHAEKQTKAASDAAAKIDKARHAIANGKAPTAKVAKATLAVRASGVPYFGDPSQDWLAARDVLNRIGLEDVYGEARMMRLFRAKDEVGGTLADLWLQQGHYAGAQRLVEDALNRQILLSADREPTGCVLMSIHKSKGKEFDGVILVEGSHSAQFFSPHEKHPHPSSRRLLRVGITRARHLVTLIRPTDAHPLVG